ncbi:MAG: RNA 3'-terminal phosphate cyclase [Gammaproteobacteria bacterium]|nr:RNA 3'-terminal phosphate cyclase [Gammaproteobacteria bacterium]
MKTEHSYVKIDGAMGEGGGQVLRTALALSVCTGRPVHIHNIRAHRKKPGLMRQHLTAVRAAGEISRAQINGDEMGSCELRFVPDNTQAGNYRFAVGSAGSATLVLQTVLYPLLLADGESQLTLEGGTHNPFAPPFDFLARAFLPLLGRMGADVKATLARYGFYPRGGGRFSVHIKKPLGRLTGFELRERGKIIEQEAKAVVTAIPEHVADRELKTVARKLSWPGKCLKHHTAPRDQGPGNVLLLTVECEHVTEVFSAFGRIGVSAETVAKQAATQAKQYLATSACVGAHLADQLLLPLALAGEGAFTTLAPSRHTMTNIEVIQLFLDVSVQTRELNNGIWLVEVASGK